MDKGKLLDVLKICGEVYDWLKVADREGGALEEFRTDARTYPALISKEGLYIPLLSLMKDVAKNTKEEKSVVSPKKAYSWVVIKILFSVALNVKNSEEYVGMDSQGRYINVRKVVDWIVNTAKGGDGIISANLVNEYLSDLLIDYLIVVKKFAEAMIPSKEAGGE